MEQLAQRGTSEGCTRKARHFTETICSKELVLLFSVPGNISGKVINGYRIFFLKKKSDDLMQPAAPSKRNFLFKEFYLNL